MTNGKEDLLMADPPETLLETGSTGEAIIAGLQLLQGERIASLINPLTVEAQDLIPRVREVLIELLQQRDLSDEGFPRDADFVGVLKNDPRCVITIDHNRTFWVESNDLLPSLIEPFNTNITLSTVFDFNEKLFDERARSILNYYATVKESQWHAFQSARDGITDQVRTACRASFTRTRLEAEKMRKDLETPWIVIDGTPENPLIFERPEPVKD